MINIPLKNFANWGTRDDGNIVVLDYPDTDIVPSVAPRDKIIYADTRDHGCTNTLYVIY